MIRVRNLKTGVEAEWSEKTYELNKTGMERGTIQFEVVSESPDVPAPISIEQFLNPEKKKSGCKRCGR